ncbi:dioxygenase family protein [Comamonas composti]|uniref:dioxygenase family protein n=1 Tax=Comamonas composti TaxID=408558 RepID=UPI00047B5042|nr:class III extradiol ring-cleavage dioxygenase [Comamonas composti]
MQDQVLSSVHQGAAMPVLYVSHGSPMFALEPGQTGPALGRWGQALVQAYGRPRAVVLLSPHWMTQGLEVMTAARPATWHDFGGFPEALYALQYPAPGAPQLAHELLQRLLAAGLPAHANPERPMDHGAWVPLRHLFPEADVPVLQISLPAGFDTPQVYALGQAVAGLREQGVLIVGSGSMTHNLAEFRQLRPAGQLLLKSGQAMNANPNPGADDQAVGGDSDCLPYVREFSRWIEQHLRQADVSALLDYRARAPHAHRAHPTQEHFLPLFFALGAAADQAGVRYLSREVMYQTLAMDAMVFGEQAQVAG